MKGVWKVSFDGCIKYPVSFIALSVAEPDEIIMLLRRRKKMKFFVVILKVIY